MAPRGWTILKWTCAWMIILIYFDRIWKHGDTGIDSKENTLDIQMSGGRTLLQPDSSYRLANTEKDIQGNSIPRERTETNSQAERNAIEKDIQIPNIPKERTLVQPESDSQANKYAIEKDIQMPDIPKERTLLQTVSNSHVNRNITKISSASDKLALFNKVLNVYYSDIERIKIQGLSPTATTANNIVKSINATKISLYESDRNFLETAKKRRDIQTVLFTRPKEEVLTTLLDMKVYPFTSNNCSLIHKFEASHIQCLKNDYTKNLPVENSSKLLREFQQVKDIGNKDSIALTYLKLIDNGTVGVDGKIEFGQAKLYPQGCDPKGPIGMHLQHENTTHADEVFSIGQMWSNQIYHGIMESISKITPYTPFLTQNEHIKIHHHRASTAWLAEVFNIPSFHNRSITTDYAHAKLLYSPAGSRCFHPNIFYMTLLKLYCQRYARLAAQSEVPQRNLIVLIKRTRSRSFLYHDAILQMLQQEATAFGLQVQVFRDDPVPSIKETALLFHRAVMVVAPHGAGESNMLFSQPGTVIIEALCYSKPGRGVYLVFPYVSRILGLQHHGVLYEHPCMEVTAEELRKPVQYYLRNIPAK